VLNSTAMPRLRPLACAAAALSLAAGASAQDRPLQTEPASTAAAGTLVLESGFDVIARQPSYVTGVERTAWSGPSVRLVYSPADAVQLDVEWVTRVGEWGEAGRGGAQSSDFGDVTLRAKWRFAGGAARRRALGARFGVTLPETSYEDKQFRPLGLGPNTLRAFVEALLTQPLGRGRLDLDLGLYLEDEVYRPHDQRDFVSYGIALDWPLGGRVSAVTEIAGHTGEGRPGANARGEWRAGLRLRSGRLRFDLALRRGLAFADGSWGGTAGVAWTLRQPPPATTPP
jgi:hypothetical protein